ncbi:MAG: TniQ family protein [Rhodocyclales bacterium]|nr:TniQ family protein [Rhodocyclales bacterium]
MKHIAHVPKVKPGESLTSLLLRLAKNHSASGHELCTLLWPQHQFWTRDIDRTVSDAQLEAIARITGLTKEVLVKATLRNMVRATGFKERIPGYQRGILPVGIYHRVRRRFGQQYCWMCLDEKPAYLRVQWRLEFMVACPKHGILLRDSCPECDAPFIPHRKHALTTAKCHSCGALLRGGDQDRPSKLTEDLQSRILAILDGAIRGAQESVDQLPPTRIGAMPGLEIEAQDFLDGVHRLCRLAARATDALPKPIIHNRVVWAFLRTKDRAIVLDRVASWIDGWPNSWISWATNRGLSQHYLTDEYGPWPDWITTAMTQIPYSLGPVNFKHKRVRITWASLRKAHRNVASYRQARAKLLLGRSGLTR